MWMLYVYMTAVAVAPGDQVQMYAVTEFDTAFECMVAASDMALVPTKDEADLKWLCLWNGE
jgi:hypothetical protein